MPPPAAPALQWTRLVVWLPACAVLGGVVAWGAVIGADYFAPIILFPLLVGVALGALTVGMIRVGQVGNRPTIIAGLVLAITVAAAGQHYVAYWSQVRQMREEAKTFRRAQALFPELTQGRLPVPPSDFVEYLRWQAARGRELNLGGYVARGPIAWLTWIVDALLLAVAAVAMVVPAIRQPYCGRCRSWYRTTRSGRLPSGAGQALASLAGVEMPEEPAWVRYRLIHCESACGPTGLLLFWENSRGDPAEGKTWLSPQVRDRVTRFLDQSRQESPAPQQDDEDAKP
ncbi:MAG: hypothetical protein HUU20_29675 [Pirellulales bacterium]|nr:hypothetical protein [Pirellulales bacterium]